MHYSLQTVCIQSVPGSKVTILGGHSTGHSKQKLVYVHVSYCYMYTCPIAICTRVLFRTVSEKVISQ